MPIQYKATLYGLRISAGGTPCRTHIIWSGGDGPGRQKSRMHTQIHVCLLRSPSLCHIFYSEVTTSSNRIGQSSQGYAREGRAVCVRVCVGDGAEDTFAYSSFFLSSSPAVGRGGSLIMFLVVFTNVSFIKHQQPWERQHPSAKVEVIIALNHLAVYLCGWLSEAKGGRPPVSPRGRRGCHCPPLLPLPLCHSYSSTYCSLLLLLLSFFLSFLLTKVLHVVVTISHVSCIFLRVCQI